MAQPEANANIPQNHWRERLGNYALLIRADRPIGILLLMWPALWALWIAGEGQPAWGVTVIFILGVTIMRSAGCAINDYADRDIDRKVERTKHRPVATGLVTPKEALGVFGALVLMAFLLVLLLNWQTILMSVVAVTLATIYPFMKRYTHLPQLALGAAFGWAVPMAFTALTETVSQIGWLLFIATVIWALIYDTQYAMVDRDDDINIGVKSTAILFGDMDLIIIGILQTTMLGILLLVGVNAEFGIFYYLGLAGATLLFTYQQYITRNREPKGCFAAFLNNNYIGAVIFAGLVLDYLV